MSIQVVSLVNYSVITADPGYTFKPFESKRFLDVNVISAELALKDALKILQVEIVDDGRIDVTVSRVGAEPGSMTQAQFDTIKSVGSGDGLLQSYVSPDASGWITVTTLAGFTSSDAAVRQNGNRFEFRGRVYGALTEGLAFAQMPAALDVKNPTSTLAVCLASTGLYTAKIGITGTISATGITGSPTWVNLDGLVVPLPTRKINLLASPASRLPIVRINTSGVALPDPALKIYIDATISIEANGSVLKPMLLGPVQVSGHGNSTWGLPKKSVKVKFASATEVLGMPADKSWRLLANHYDETLIRNGVCFDMMRGLYESWTPRYEYCELYLNDQYQGCYQMTEPVKAGDSRLPVSITKSADTGLAATGAYLVEINERLEIEGGNGFRSVPSNVPIQWDDPDPPSAPQITYLQGYINAFDAALMGGTWLNPVSGYAQYVDMNSWADWYLVSELSRNQDAVFYSSVKLYKSRDTATNAGKLFLGPLWDSDLSLGNAYNGISLSIRDFSGDPTLWHVRAAVWIKRMMLDPAFITVLNARWLLLKASLYGSNGVIQKARLNAQKVAAGASSNARRWGLAGDSVTRAEMALHWLQRRIEWLDARIANPTITNFTINPKAVTNTTGYAVAGGNGTAGLTQAADNPLGGSSARATWSAGTTTQGGIYYSQFISTVGVNPGDTITVAVFYRTSKNMAINTGVDIKTDAGALLSSFAKSVTAAGGELNVALTTLVVPALGTRAFCFLYSASGFVFGTGDWVEICGINQVKANVSDLSYADGASANWAWSGTPYASVSTGWNL